MLIEVNLAWVFRKNVQGSLTTYLLLSELGTVDIFLGSNGTLSPALSHCALSTCGSMETDV